METWKWCFVLPRTNCSLRKKAHSTDGVILPVIPGPLQNQVVDLTLCLWKASQHHQLPPQTDRAGTSRGSWRWKSHWFHLHWKVLHAPLDFSAAFVQESFRPDTHYLHTQKRILQPWITNANRPVLSHYIFGSSYQLATKDVLMWIHDSRSLLL